MRVAPPVVVQLVKVEPVAGIAEIEVVAPESTAPVVGVVVPLPIWETVRVRPIEWKLACTVSFAVVVKLQTGVKFDEFKKVSLFEISVQFVNL